ncbi:MAG TPA: glycosyltransferase [Nitrospiraceae bacterium]|nr:glycosyltransferase [Nitrospiraceae bacterium]
MPTKVCEVEFSEEVRPIWGTERYEWLHVLARYRGHPLGWITVPNTRIEPVVSADRVRQAMSDQVVWSLGRHVLKSSAGTPSAGATFSSPMSVVVCTRDRSDLLAGCLHALLALDYPKYEIIVVDNAPSSDETARLVASFPVRYVRENRPGLDWARNRGILEARHEIVAFTDDDARADPRWLQGFADAFAIPDVTAVTGLVAPAELETPAQQLFEFTYGGMGKGMQRRIVRTQSVSEKDLFWAHVFGVGANMAFRRSVFADIGAFDVALDVGTPSGSGGDLEMFHRLVAKGYTLVYEPSALVWHIHRRSSAVLRSQLYDNGRGFGSYLLTCWRNRTVSRSALLQFVVWDWLGWWLCRRVLRPRGLPRRLVLAELVGALLSPFAYRAAQTRARQVCQGASLRSDRVHRDSTLPAHGSSVLPQIGHQQAECDRSVSLEAE